VAPGAFVSANSSTYPTAGSIIASTTSPFSSGTFAGSLVSAVYTNDAANPYGGLTFTYLLNLSSSSVQSVSQVTVSAFDSFLTDISYNPGSGGVAPSNFSRSSDGSVVRFSFFSPNVNPGTNSALVVVQTGSQAYSSTLAGIIDGTTVNVASYAPLVVPE